MRLVCVEAADESPPLFLFVSKFNSMLFFASGKKNVADDRNSDEPSTGLYRTNDQQCQYNQPVPPGNFFEVSPGEPKEKNQRTEAENPTVPIGKTGRIIIPRQQQHDHTRQQNDRNDP